MNHIRMFREKRAWTQRQLAEKIGVTTDQISKLERGQRRLSQHWMERIAAALDVSAAALIVGEPYIEVKGEITGTGNVCFHKGTHKRIPVPPGIPSINTLAAVEVKDDGLLPLCGKGWHLCYRTPDVKTSAESMPSGLSIVALADKRVLLREVRKGYTYGTYNLYIHNSPPLEDQSIQWAGRVVALIPGDQGL